MGTKVRKKKKEEEEESVCNVSNVRNNRSTIILQRTRIKNTPLAICISDTPVTLKQSQGYQISNDNVDPKQGYNHVKFERSCFNGVQEKAKVSFLQTRKYVNHLL